MITSRNILILAGLATLSFTAPLSAVTIVNFTSDDIDSSNAPGDLGMPGYSTIADRDSDSIDDRGRFNFTTSYLNDSPTGTNASTSLPRVFGGGSQIEFSDGSSDNFSLPEASVGFRTGGSGPDRLEFESPRQAGPNVFRALLAVDSANFLGTGGQTVFFGAGDSMSISSDGVYGTPDETRALNFVVRANGLYYISENFINTKSTTLNVDSTDLFAQFDPTVFNFDDVDATNVTGTTSLGALGEIDAVGIFWDSLPNPEGSGKMSARVEEWVVDATVIPEPSAAALVIVAIGVLALRRRSR